MSNTKTLAANMRNAFVERRHATIGGGKFTPEELRDGAIALSAYDDMLAALQKIVAVHNASHNPMQARRDMYATAREALAKATGATQ